MYLYPSFPRMFAEDWVRHDPTAVTHLLTRDSPSTRAECDGVTAQTDQITVTAQTDQTYQYSRSSTFLNRWSVLRRRDVRRGPRGFSRDTTWHYTQYKYKYFEHCTSSPTRAREA
jgi:hypothetical protein